LRNKYDVKQHKLLTEPYQIAVAQSEDVIAQVFITLRRKYYTYIKSFNKETGLKKIVLKKTK
jgi:hypothetical protein